jgi:hypothetical protein
MPVDSTGAYKMNPRLGSTPTQPAGPPAPTSPDPEASPSENQTMVVHSHDKGHTLHVMHEDGTSEKEDYNKGDEDQVADSVRSHLGGSSDQGMDLGGEEPPPEQGNPGF